MKRPIPLWKYELMAYFKNGKRSRMKVTMPEYIFMEKFNSERTKKNNT